MELIAMRPFFDLLPNMNEGCSTQGAVACPILNESLILFCFVPFSLKLALFLECQKSQICLYIGLCKYQHSNVPG